MSDDNSTIAQAARLNLAPDLTPEQRENAIANRETRIEAATINRAAGDVTEAEAAARRDGVWTAELLNATDASSRYGILNNISDVLKTVWAYFSTSLGGNASDGLFLELARNEKYRPVEGSPIITGKPETEGIDGAQARFQRDFPEAAAGTAQNLDTAPAPSQVLRQGITN